MRTDQGVILLALVFWAGAGLAREPGVWIDPRPPEEQAQRYMEPIMRTPIQILGAVYGDGLNSACDPRPALAREVYGRIFAKFRVGNELCGDPSPKRRKKLEIRYLCANTGEIKEDWAWEGNKILLSCEPE